MPAKKRNDSKYKPFLGRVFALRKHKKIPCYYDNTTCIEKSFTDIGEAVFVIDENNTRAKITLKNGSYAWIPKFFLHKEIEGEVFKGVDTLAHCIQKLLTVYERLTLENENTMKYSSQAEEIKQVVRILRQHSDFINPTIGKST